MTLTKRSTGTGYRKVALDGFYEASGLVDGTLEW